MEYLTTLSLTREEGPDDGDRRRLVSDQLGHGKIILRKQIFFVMTIVLKSNLWYRSLWTNGLTFCQYKSCANNDLSDVENWR